MKTETDFNDLHKTAGIEVVREQIQDAIEAAKKEMEHIDRTVKKFEMRLDGLYCLSDQNGAEKLCSHFKVVGVARTFDSQGWSKVIELTNDDHKSERIVIPSGDLIGKGDEVVQNLVNAGLQVHSFQAPRLIKEFIMRYPQKKKLRITERTGFHRVASTKEQVFLLGSECIGRATEEVLQIALPHGAPSLKTNGSLEDWKANIASLAEGQSRMTFAISTAFAASLLRPLGLEGGICHLYGSSSRGKSLMLKIASSVVGGPSRDYVKLFRTSVNGPEGLCSASTDILLCLDELGQLPPEQAGDCVYMITNGAGKVRADKSGEARKQKTWLTLALTNGEIPISAHIKEGGKQVRAGHEVRALDIPAVASKEFGVFDFLPDGFADSYALAKHLEESIERNYGLAIRPFIESVLADSWDLHAEFAKERERLLALLPQKLNGQVKRVIDRFALISLAGQQATRLGLTGWSEGNARKSVGNLMLEWLGERNATEDAENKKVIQAIQNFISQHEARFYPLNADNTGASNHPVRDRAGFMKLDGSGGVTCWYFLGEVFDNEVLKGIPRKTAMAVLKDLQLLEGGKSTTQISAAGKKQPRVVPVMDAVMAPQIASA